MDFWKKIFSDHFSLKTFQVCIYAFINVIYTLYKHFSTLVEYVYILGLPMLIHVEFYKAFVNLGTQMLYF